MNQTLEERRKRQDLIEVFKISQEKSIIGLQDLFTLDKNNKRSYAKIK